MLGLSFGWFFRLLDDGFLYCLFRHDSHTPSERNPSSVTNAFGICSSLFASILSETEVVQNVGVTLQSRTPHKRSAPPPCKPARMAKDAIALLLVTLLRVRPWKLVENVLDRHQDHCSCGLLLAPIEHQLFLLQFFQERLRHLLHFRRLLFVRRPSPPPPAALPTPRRGRWWGGG
jgi:hypothetical protein